MEDEVPEKTRWRKAKDTHTVEEVCLQRGALFGVTRNTGLENFVKIVGKESSRGSDRESCKERESMQVKQRRKRCDSCRK